MFFVGSQGEAGAKNPVYFARYSEDNTGFGSLLIFFLLTLPQGTHTLTTVLPLLVGITYPKYVYFCDAHCLLQRWPALLSHDETDLNLDFQESTGNFKLNSKR